MQDITKEHERDIRLARIQTSAVSEHANNTGHYPPWNEVKFIDRDPHWYTRRVNEAIHIRLHPNSINRDSGMEISETWTPAIKIQYTRQQENRSTADRRGNNTPKQGGSKCINHSCWKPTNLSGASCL